jgi:apolipoprotein N-acyltransferase
MFQNNPSAAKPGLFVTQRLGVGPALLALLGGVVHAASLAWPTDTPEIFQSIGLTRGQPLWWGQTLALALLVHVLMASHSPRRAAWLGWLFATAWLACTFGWLFTSMHTYGGLAAPLAVLAVLMLAGTLALYYAGASWCFSALALYGRAQEAIIFVALWALAELARGLLLSGFGWGAAGYAHVNGPLAPTLPWLGVYGVSALAAALAVMLALLWRASGWRAAAGPGISLALLLALAQCLPASQGASAGKLDVTLLQGNIAQNEKFDQESGVPAALRWYGEQLNASRTSLVISPETAFAVLPEQLPEGYWQALLQRFSGGGQAALIGMPLGNYDLGYTNSVVGFKPGQAEPWRYDKHHLVPFGEFIPPMFRWFTKLMNIPLGDFNRGALVQPTFDWQGQRLATSICYENLFSEELAAQFVNAAAAPTMMVNMSNLGWFGEHLAMDQHLHIARLRALEFERPFLLATNTGQTAVVNHLGQVTHAARSHQAVALTAEVQGRTGITPYAAWVSRFGQWPVCLLALAVVLAAVCRAHRADQGLRTR